MSDIDMNRRLISSSTASPTFSTINQTENSSGKTTNQFSASIVPENSHKERLQYISNAEEHNVGELLFKHCLRSIKRRKKKIKSQKMRKLFASHKHQTPRLGCDDAGKKCANLYLPRNDDRPCYVCFFYYLLIVGNPKFQHKPQAVS